MNHSPKLGLVLSAGGARGAFQFGAWQALAQNGIQFSHIAGSSIGALNGALACQGDVKAGNELWMELTRTELLDIDYGKLGRLGLVTAMDIALFLAPIPNLRTLKVVKYVSALAKMISTSGSLGMLKASGIYSLEELRPLLEKFIDMDYVIRSDKSLYVTACGEPDLQNLFGAPHCFRLQDYTADQAWKSVIASMAIPFIFSSVEVNGVACSDGGLANWLPIDPLYESDVRKLVIISTRNTTELSKQDYTGTSTLVIKPPVSLGRFPFATLNFDETTVLEWIKLGFMEGTRALYEHGHFFRQL
jgi:NTE family protein